MAWARMLDVTLSTAPCTVWDTIADGILAGNVGIIRRARNGVS